MNPGSTLLKHFVQCLLSLDASRLLRVLVVAAKHPTRESCLSSTLGGPASEAGAAPADFGFRPGSNLGGPLVLYGSQYPGGKAFNPAAFTQPPTGQLGDFGRNVLRSFGAWQADVAFQRQFRLTEKMALRFRGGSFNLFNHRNFGPPNNNLTDALFGQSTQTLAGRFVSNSPGSVPIGWQARALVVV
jgi:hypothetical protein